MNELPESYWFQRETLEAIIRNGEEAKAKLIQLNYQYPFSISKKSVEAPIEES
jgi:predicted RNase H-like HicB family nuclease